MNSVQNPKRRWAVLQFRGSNCDHDAIKAIAQVKGIEARLHWADHPITPGDYEVVIIPGGFSYGDYLRAGAIAKLTPAMQSLEPVVEAGAHVIGICNGFQILLEARLLPGFLQVNQSLRFRSRLVSLSIKREAFPWYTAKDVGQVVKYPIAHGFGNYQPSPIDSLEADRVLEYQENPNGSFQNTAGIHRRFGKGSFFGLMPHPERAAFEALRLTDGLHIFQNAAKALAS